MEFEVSDQDIELTEKILLPEGACFPDDARNVIRCWRSADVAACPGSGKTTVLMAKLKLLADRMPLENGAGICVLSHTNVAVNEIRKRLSRYADKLLNYPNYVGTIQSFIDRFVTIPYIRSVAGRNVQVIDDITYAQHMLSKMQTDYTKYRTLNYLIKQKFESDSQFTKIIDYIKVLHIRSDGSLYVEKHKRPLACAHTLSVKQYNALTNDILKSDGVIRYKDAYLYAKDAVDALSTTYTDLFSARFKYVFIDEYQDCNDLQREALDAIFNSEKCNVLKIGDPDQAIYNLINNDTIDWVPKDGFLSITTSCRYSQEIANVICKLKNGNKNISTMTGISGIKPILFIFDPEKIDRVIDEFIEALDRYGLYDDNGVYKVIGAIKNEGLAGLKIGNYWPDFDCSENKKIGYNYWGLIDNIATSLLAGDLYKAERIVRTILCRLFHYAKIINPMSGRDYSIVTIKKLLDDEYRDIYRQCIYEISNLDNFQRETIDCIIREKVNEIIKTRCPHITDIFNNLPGYFIDKDVTVCHTQKSEINVFIEPTRNRRIEFDTIHGVKGETHDATLYLETESQRASDLSRILPYFGIGRCGTSNLFDYSRKLAYVGMSRPKKLLCVAIQSKTYEKGKKAFANDWEIIDLRE